MDHKIATFLHPNFKKFKFVTSESLRTMEHQTVKNHIETLTSCIESYDIPKKVKFDGKYLFLKYKLIILTLKMFLKKIK